MSCWLTDNILQSKVQKEIALIQGVQISTNDYLLSSYSSKKESNFSMVWLIKAAQ